MLLALGAVAGAATAAKRKAPAHLLINAQEWSLWPSRGTVPAGTVLVELWNRGQDMHDAWIRRLNNAGQMVGPVVGRMPVTMPGRVSNATWHLKAGHYELFCSMPGHMALGMHAKLTVKRS
jgi:plastocyanin